MLNASLLTIIEETGVNILTLTEGLEQEEFFALRLTPINTLQQLRTVVDSILQLPLETQAILAEIDWPGWHAVARQLNANTPEARDAIWFAIRSLVPAMLMWLRIYRKNQPELFSYNKGGYLT